MRCTVVFRDDPWWNLPEFALVVDPCVSYTLVGTIRMSVITEDGDLEEVSQDAFDHFLSLL